MGERRGTKALELWCRRMVEGYKNVRVDNMTTSWRDGLAFCALVSKCSTLKQTPDLVHFDELKKEEIYHNNELAFRVAEEYLNIPALLDPQDMVDYEVPDKLSILTYLSQFYQVFGAQENSLRLKRSSTSEANKSSSTTPPAKMANVIPKREACVKCKNPVFFAERLVFNQKLHHRTCFRCARCNSILTIGCFYETENDDEYCCETCPDEEKPATKVEETNRLTIAQKIALFEKDTSSVLKKSLSDEEKSRSLSRQAPVNSEALNSFLNTQITTQDENEKTNQSVSSSESDSEDEDTSAPPVPSSHPPHDVIPSISDKRIELSDHKIISDNYVVTKELTHGKDTEAIANTAETHSESHVVRKDIESEPVVVIESDKRISEVSHDDDFEMLFEQLAEDAVNTPVVSIPLVTSPPKIVVVEKVKDEEVKVEEKVDVIEEKVEIPMEEKLIPAVQEVIEEASPVVEEVIEATPPPVVEEEAQLDVKPSVEIVEVLGSSENVIEPSLLVTDKPIELVDESIKITEAIVEEITQPDDEATYPDDLNPFGDDEPAIVVKKPEPPKRPSLNPFGSDDDEEDEVRPNNRMSMGTLPKPPRPPPPKTATLKPSSTNPFGSEDEDDEAPKPYRTPIPTPRKPFLHSATPEPTLRSLSAHNSPGQSFKGSTSSLSSSTDGMSLRRKKKKAPAPPVPSQFVNLDDSTSIKTPSTTPKKKRPAPTPPSSTPKPSSLAQEPAPTLSITTSDISSTGEPQSLSETNESLSTVDSSIETASIASQPSRRLIPLEECLIEEGASTGQPESEEAVTYRRKIVPLSAQSTQDESYEHFERSKDNKEAQNRQRQSQASLSSMRTGSESTDSLPYLNKSSHGKWKRRKGPAPALPSFPQRRILQMLPLQEIRQELEVIEVQQQGLEKQGVMLEKMIRERCEGTADNRTTEELLEALPSSKNPKEVEELILQLFELVNEKNELFRRQAELMYLRRAHRLEEEQADVEYEIRTLMAQPEQNKTDSDKAKEEALIARLVEIVQLRNEVVDCLDRDRLREAEEDMSIKQRMESHTAKLDQEYLNQTPTKLSKKEKKKLKEAKKLKNKKLDADKDLDTSEIKSETGEKKKKKKKFLF